MKLAYLFAALALPAAALPVPLELLKGTASPEPGPTVVLLGNGKNLFGGWNHIPSDPSLRVVSRGTDALEYEPAVLDWVESPGDRPAVPVILVKKLGNWDHQHANGLEGLWGGLTYDELAAIVVDVKLDTKATQIPSAAELKHRFGQWLNDDDLAALDGQKAILRVTVTGPSQVWSAETWLVIDPKTQGDRWLRFEIPIGDFVHFRGEPWNQKPLDPAELAGARVGHIRIEPESMGSVRERWGNVVRNFHPELWDKGTPPPETVKEIGLKFSAVYAKLKG